MSYQPAEISKVRRRGAGIGGIAVPVILDHGDRARVVTVTFPRSPHPGDRFALEGTTWEIARAKDFQRGFVARPVRPGFCVH